MIACVHMRIRVHYLRYTDLLLECHIPKLRVGGEGRGKVGLLSSITHSVIPSDLITANR